MDLTPKNNDLELGGDMAWYACPCGLLVNSFNGSGWLFQIFVLLSLF